MAVRRPLMMVAREYGGSLFLIKAKCSRNFGFVKALADITTIGSKIDDVEVDAVIRREIVLELGFQLPDFVVLVGAFARFGAILGFERVAAAVVGPVLSAGVVPRSAAEAFGVGDQAETVAFE